jgi:hypothetical protein
MAFQPGDQKPEKSGMKKGQLTKKNQEIQELAQELGCNPAKVLMLIMLGDKESLGIDEMIDLDRKMTAAKELMPYLYGKRKPIDSDGDDKGDPITELINAFRNK